MSLSGDFNVLKTLKSGSETLNDDQRLRTTQSYILRGAYTLAGDFGVEGFFPVIRQTRRINTLSGTLDREATFGIGDPVLLLIYDISRKGITARMGAGPQIPLGSTTKTDNRGLLLLEDLQPGSGTWDLITFASFEYSIPERPSSIAFLNAIYSMTGKNDGSRGGSQSYEFGNDIQVIGGYSDQVLIGTQLIVPGISFRYRFANRDLVNDQELPGTGGEFIFTRLSTSFPMGNSSSNLHFNFEFPLMTRVNETQLATSFIVNVGWSKSFSSNKFSESLIDLN